MDQQPADWLSALVDQYGRMVLTTAYRILGRREEAEDVLQDVFLKLLGTGNRRAGGGIRDWGAFLRTMASRSAIDRLRRKRKEGRDLALARGNMPSPQANDPGRIVSRQGQASDLRQAIAELPARDAEVFSLRYLDDLSYDQIAAQMRLSVNQVGVILHRARRRLREILDRRGVEQGE